MRSFRSVPARAAAVFVAMFGAVWVAGAAPATGEHVADPVALEGSFNLIQMVHTTNYNDGEVRAAVPWDGKSEGTFTYASIPCTGNAPVNNISTDLTTYNSRIEGSRSPASTRSHALEFTATKRADGSFALTGRDTLTVCHLKGGPTPNPDPTPDPEKSKITFDWTADAVRTAPEEVAWSGAFTLTGGTGEYADLTGGGSITGYLFCFAPEGCSNIGKFRDAQFTMSGVYSDPHVESPLRTTADGGVVRPAPTAVGFPPPSPTGYTGNFSVMQMVHTTPFNSGAVENPAPWDGTEAGGPFRYASIPCSGNAPVNNIATNLTTYNSRLPGSRSPASTRMHPLEFTVEEVGGKTILSGSNTMTVCQLRGGARSTPDPVPDAQKAKIHFDWTAEAVRTSVEEVSWAGTFTITGGTGEYADLRGSGELAGYFFCFAPGGCESLGEFRDGQFTMAGDFDDPSIATRGGYRMTATDGGVFSFGDDKFFGSTGDIALNQPIVGMANTPSDDGYWLAASDGGIFTFGDAKFLGSAGDITLNKPVVDIAATPRGDGYWMAATDGGIFNYGGAAFHGSTGDIALNKPIVGMAATATGKGYWLVASDGGIFSFGDAAFHGSTGDIALNKPIVGMARTMSGHGYWLVASDGGIFSFGDAAFHGSTGNIALNQPIVAMSATETGDGYWMVASDGGIFSFGDAPFLGSTGNIKLNKPIVEMSV